jgi:hypothetical protein
MTFKEQKDRIYLPLIKGTEALKVYKEIGKKTNNFNRANDSMKQAMTELYQKILKETPEAIISTPEHRKYIREKKAATSAKKSDEYLKNKHNQANKTVPRGTSAHNHDFGYLEGALVNVWFLGASDPDVQRIKSIAVTPEKYLHRNIDIVWEGPLGAVAILPLSAADSFLKGESVEVIENGEPVLYELIPESVKQKAAKGTRLNKNTAGSDEPGLSDEKRSAIVERYFNIRKELDAPSEYRIYKDMAKTKQFAKKMQSAVQEEGIEMLSKEDYDWFAKENYDLLNQFLLFNGYYPSSDFFKNKREKLLDVYAHDIRSDNHSASVVSPVAIVVKDKQKAAFGMKTDMKSFAQKIAASGKEHLKTFGKKVAHSSKAKAKELVKKASSEGKKQFGKLKKKAVAKGKKHVKALKKKVVSGAKKHFKKLKKKAAAKARTGFKALSKKVAESYHGKPVERKYRSKYGKTYSKKEALEVGKKVAAKVYQKQQK